MNDKQRVPTDGGQALTHNPFANLKDVGLPPGPPENASDEPASSATGNRESKRGKNRGRVDIIRQTAHRGGKTVTVVSGFVGIGLPEKERARQSYPRRRRSWLRCRTPSQRRS